MRAFLYSFDLASVRVCRRQKDWLRASPGYMRVETLSKCLEGFKKYIEHILSISPAPYQQFTIIQTECLVVSLIIVFRLSFALQEQPKWNALAARNYAPMSMYLDSISYQLRGMSSIPVIGSVPPNPDFAFIFRMVLESLRSTYHKKVAASTQQSQTGSSNSSEQSSNTDSMPLPITRRTPNSCPMFDPDMQLYFETWRTASTGPSILNTGGMELKNTSEPLPVFHDIWATMTQGWAESEPVG